MARQVYVSGSVTIGDDGSVTGSLLLSGNVADPGAGAPADSPAAGAPLGDTPTDAAGNVAGDQSGAVTTPDPADLPPYAPDVPAGDPPPAGIGTPDPATGGATDLPLPGEAAATDLPEPGVDTPDVPVAGTDPTTAGTDAGPATDPAAGSGPGTDADPGPAWPGRTLRRDAHQRTADPAVRTFQQAAADNGFTVGPVDGFFGPRTENGVRAVQAAAGLEQTGVIDADTWHDVFTTLA